MKTKKQNNYQSQLNLCAPHKNKETTFGAVTNNSSSLNLYPSLSHLQTNSTLLPPPPSQPPIPPIETKPIEIPQKQQNLAQTNPQKQSEKQPQQPKAQPPKEDKRVEDELYSTNIKTKNENLVSKLISSSLKQDTQNKNQQQNLHQLPPRPNNNNNNNLNYSKTPEQVLKNSANLNKLNFDSLSQQQRLASTLTNSSTQSNAAPPQPKPQTNPGSNEFRILNSSQQNNSHNHNHTLSERSKGTSGNKSAIGKSKFYLFWISIAYIN